MATKPTQTTAWATDAAAVKTEPPAGKKVLGFTGGEQPPEAFLNWLQNLVELWLQWVDENVVDDTNAQSIDGLKTFAKKIIAPAGVTFLETSAVTMASGLGELTFAINADAEFFDKSVPGAPKISGYASGFYAAPFFNEAASIVVAHLTISGKRSFALYYAPPPNTIGGWIDDGTVDIPLTLFFETQHDGSVVKTDMFGDLDMGGNEVLDLPATPSATGAASKEYVDANPVGSIIRGCSVYSDATGGDTVGTTAVVLVKSENISLLGEVGTTAAGTGFTASHSNFELRKVPTIVGTYEIEAPTGRNTNDYRLFSVIPADLYSPGSSPNEQNVFVYRPSGATDLWRIEFYNGAGGETLENAAFLLTIME